MRSLSVLAFAVLSLSAAAASGQPAKVSGYVTHVGSSRTFDLEGVHILTTSATKYSIRPYGSAGSTATPAPTDYFLGETLDAIGQMDHSSHTLTATEITVIPVSVARVDGTAVIDLMPSPLSQVPRTDRMIRADGYLLHITAQTHLNLDPAIKSIADIATNQWIQYSGIQQLDGTVLLDYAGVGPNRVNNTEEKLRKKTEYDPSVVPSDAHQSAISEGFSGVDPKRIPAYQDQEMQARVERIGESLIPAYQRGLPDSDPTKVHFRFQVIDATKWHDALSLSSGIILVPRQVVERMQNDDQLATVLADNIAEAIDKEALRSLTANTVKTISSDAVTAGVILLGPAEFVGGLVADHYASKAIDRTLQQSGRVSLCYLHDAGYDITQAPLAWWLLAPKQPKPITDTKLPPRAITLYIALGTTWHPATAPPH